MVVALDTAELDGAIRVVNADGVVINGDEDDGGNIVDDCSNDSASDDDDGDDDGVISVVPINNCVSDTFPSRPPMLSDSKVLLLLLLLLDCSRLKLVTDIANASNAMDTAMAAIAAKYSKERLQAIVVLSERWSYHPIVVHDHS